jgi:hypothetical protein
VLRLLGLRLNAGVRLLIGIALIAIAVAREDSAPMLLVGIALLVWGTFDLLAAGLGRARHGTDGRRDR